MLKLLLGKTFNLEAVPVAVAMSGKNVLVTMRASNGSMFEVSFTSIAARPSETTFEVRKAKGPDAEYNPAG